MPRNTFSTDFKTALAQGTVSPGVALGVRRKDDSLFGFTNRDRVVTLAELVYEYDDKTLTIPSVTYRQDVGAIPTNLQQGDDPTKAGNLEVKLTLSNYILAADCDKKKFQGAEWWLIIYNRADITQQALMCRGRVGEVRIVGQQAIFKLRSLSDQLKGEIIDLTSPLNRLTWDEIEALGYFDLDDDTDDGFPARVTTTIDSVEDDRREITVAATIGPPTGRYVEGTVEWLDGNNEGYTASIMDWNHSTGAMTLWKRTPDSIEAGDSVRVTIACPSTASEWKLVFGDKQYFGGEPEITTIEKSNEITQL